MQQATAVVPVVMPSQQWPLGARFTPRTNFGATPTSLKLSTPTLGDASSALATFAPDDTASFSTEFTTGPGETQPAAPAFFALKSARRDGDGLVPLSPYGHFTIMNLSIFGISPFFIHEINEL